MPQPAVKMVFGGKNLLSLLEDALRLDGRSLGNRSCAPVAARHAGRLLDPLRRLGMIAALLGLFQQRDQRGLGVGNDAHIRGDHVADLGGLDIDVDELPVAA